MPACPLSRDLQGSGSVNSSDAFLIKSFIVNPGITRVEIVS
jgi:hypothetical protein